MTATFLKVAVFYFYFIFSLENIKGVDAIIIERNELIKALIRKSTDFVIPEAAGCLESVRGIFGKLFCFVAGVPDTINQTMLKIHNYYVYIMANTKDSPIYIGMTSSLLKRITEHRTKVDLNSFTARNNIFKLAYYENCQYVWDAIAREKQLKGWNRQWKINLIEKENSVWRDFYYDML